MVHLNKADFIKIIYTGFLDTGNRIRSYINDSGEIYLEGFTINHDIKVEEFDIDKSIRLNKCEITSLSFKKISFNENSLHLEECQIDSIEIETIDQMGTLNITNCEIRNISLFECGIIALGLFHNSVKKFLVLNSVVIEIFATLGNKFRQLEILNSQILCDFTSNQDIIEDQCLFSADFNGTFAVRSQLKCLLDVFGGSFKKRFDVQYGVDYIQGISILSGNFDELIIDSSKFRELSITPKNDNDQVSINHLELRNIGDQNVVIDKCQIFNLAIGGPIYSNGKISIKDTNIKSLWFVNVNNNGNLSFSNIHSKLLLEKEDGKNNPASILNFYNSNLGNCHFSKFQFNSYREIYCVDSRFSEIVLTTIGFPETKNSNIYTSQYSVSEEMKDSNPNVLENLYSQLYQAAQKQANRSQEVIYYKEYLDWHRRNKVNELKGKGIRSITNGDWQTPISLWFHKISSNYGTDWARAVLLTFFTSLMIYILFILSHENIVLVNSGNLEIKESYFSFFWQFIIPTHNFIKFDGADSTPLSYFIDFISRITSGFLIYQTVTAFRRFGKR